MYTYLQSVQFVMFWLAVENESHCDFVKLREMLIRTNMEDMREKTHLRHYELYRKKRLEQVILIYQISLSFSSFLRYPAGIKKA